MSNPHPSPIPLHLDGAPPWVEVSTEVCRAGRVLHTISNRRTGVAITAEATDLLADGSPGPDLRDALVDVGAIGARAPDDDTGVHGVASIRTRLARFAATLDLPLMHADRTVRRLHRAGLHVAFRPLALVAQGVIAIGGLVALLVVWARHPSIELHVPASRVPLVLGLGLVAVAIHELAHALVIVHHGRRVDAIGFRLHLGTPAFYVESVDALHLSRGQRMAQAAAGPWAEWLVTSCAACAALALPAGPASWLLIRFALLNTINVVSNLLPFVGLDGALLLADALHEPDLPQRSRGATGRLVTALVHRDLVDAQAWGLAAYSAANAVVATALLAFSLWMWTNLFGDAVASLWGSGPIGILLLAATAFVIVRPALTVVAPRAIEAMETVGRIAHEHRFRRSTWWRVAAIHALVDESPQVAALDLEELGLLAGLLVRVRRPEPAARVHRVVFAGVRFRRPVYAAVPDSALLRLRHPSGAAAGFAAIARRDTIRGTRGYAPPVAFEAAAIRSDDARIPGV